MKHAMTFGLASCLALSMMACGGTTAQHPDPRVPGEGTAGCEGEVYQAQSAWFHGQGAPAGQAQIGHGGTMKDLHRQMVDQQKYAAADPACSQHTWQTVR